MGPEPANQSSWDPEETQFSADEHSEPEDVSYEDPVPPSKPAAQGKPAQPPVKSVAAPRTKSTAAGCPKPPDGSPLSLILQSADKLSPEDRQILKSGADIVQKHLQPALPPVNPPVQSPQQPSLSAAEEALARATDYYKRKHKEYLKAQQAAAAHKPLFAPPSVPVANVKTAGNAVPPVSGQGIHEQSGAGQPPPPPASGLASDRPSSTSNVAARSRSRERDAVPPPKDPSGRHRSADRRSPRRSRQRSSDRSGHQDRPPSRGRGRSPPRRDGPSPRPPHRGRTPPPKRRRSGSRDPRRRSGSRSPKRQDRRASSSRAPPNSRERSPDRRVTNLEREMARIRELLEREHK
jgi:hypothetical protein